MTNDDWRIKEFCLYLKMNERAYFVKKAKKIESETARRHSIFYRL